MNDLAVEMIRLSEHMADVATRIRAAGKSISAEARADELMDMAGRLVEDAGKLATGFQK